MTSSQYERSSTPPSLDFRPLMRSGFGAYRDPMYVTAFSSPRHPKWRWRITDINGAVIEESESTFDTITLAVAGGTERLVHVNGDDRPILPSRPWGTRHYLRREHV